MAVYVSVPGCVCVCVCVLPTRVLLCVCVCATYACVTVCNVLWLRVCDYMLVSVRECIPAEVLQICE